MRPMNELVPLACVRTQLVVIIKIKQLSIRINNNNKLYNNSSFMSA